MTGTVVTIGRKPPRLLMASSDELYGSLSMVTSGCLVVAVTTGEWGIMLVPVIVFGLIIAASQKD